MSSDEPQAVRPTKKQRDLLTYIEQFITEHGYSPSYREIMNGLEYTSVATVALHVNSLISRGHLRKRDRSARSLEVVKDTSVNLPDASAPATSQPQQQGWLIAEIEKLFQSVEQAAATPAHEVAQLSSLVGTLQLLGMETAAAQYSTRLETLLNPPEA